MSAVFESCCKFVRGAVAMFSSLAADLVNELSLVLLLNEFTVATLSSCENRTVFSVFVLFVVRVATLLLPGAQ
jgi:hypothetical protein